MTPAEMRRHARRAEVRAQFVPHPESGALLELARALRIRAADREHSQPACRRSTLEGRDLAGGGLVNVPSKSRRPTLDRGQDL